MSQRPVAVIVDDEPANRDFLVRLITQAQFEAHGAASGQAALELAASFDPPPQLAIVDSQLPDIAGVEVIGELRARYPEMLIIMATMLDDRPLMDKAFARGCNAFLVKPHGFMELFKRLQKGEPLHQLLFDQYGVRPFKPVT